MPPQVEKEIAAVAKTRSKINAAKGRCGQSWQKLFAEADKDGSGTLNLRELQIGLRTLVPARTVCDYDIKLLFDTIDADGSGTLELQELLEYLTTGPTTEAEEAAKAEKRIERAQRSIKMAFDKLSTNEADIRKLFKTIDPDDDGVLSMFEFETFVRRDLALTPWEVKKKELEALYKLLDTDGDGLETEELIAYIRGRRKTAGPPGTTTGPVFRRPIRPTYRQTLEKDVLYNHRLGGGLGKSPSCPPQGSSFVNLGRSKAPVSRIYTSSSSVPSLPRLVGNRPDSPPDHFVEYDEMSASRMFWSGKNGKPGYMGFQE